MEQQNSVLKQDYKRIAKYPIQFRHMFEIHHILQQLKGNEIHTVIIVRILKSYFFQFYFTINVPVQVI
jgi:hypothetical protein